MEHSEKSLKRRPYKKLGFVILLVLIFLVIVGMIIFRSSSKGAYCSIGNVNKRFIGPDISEGNINEGCYIGLNECDEDGSCTFPLEFILCDETRELCGRKVKCKCDK
jgi:hypothetical protein